MSTPIASCVRVEARRAGSGEGETVSRELVAKTPWISLFNLRYWLGKDEEVDGKRFEREWSSVSRSNKGSGPDAVAVVALIRDKSGDDSRILLVKQFRPPVGCVTVELPAGLIDDGESPGEAALRELREETGFGGVVSSVCPAEPLSPGLSDESVVRVHVDVCGQTKQHLQDSESIEVVSVPLRRLSECLTYFQREEGCVVMQAVSCLALGVDLGKSMSSNGSD